MTDEEYNKLLDENEKKTSYEEVPKPEGYDKGFLDKLMDLPNVLMGAARGDYDTESKDGPIDTMKFNYNKYVAQELRDKNSNDTPFYQPDTVVKDGKEYKTNNKLFNDMTPEELAYEKHIASQERSDEPEKDPFVYELMNGQMDKTGVAKEGEQVRYMGNPLAQNWDVKKNVQTKNASYIEKLTHGNANNLNRRVFDYASDQGKTSNNPLGEARTEIYGSDALFGRAGTKTKQTEVQKVAAVKSEQILSDNKYKGVADEIKDVNKTVNFRDTLKGAKTTGDFATAMEKNPDRIHMDELVAYKKYQELAQSIDSEIIPLEGNTPREKAKSLNEFASKFNTNLTYMGMKLMELSGNPKLTKNVMEAIQSYDATKTDAVQVVRGGLNMLTDPSNLIGAGEAATVARLAGKGVAKKGLMKLLKSMSARAKASPMNAVKAVAKAPITQSAGIGAGYTTAFDAGKQRLNIMGGKQDGYNVEQGLKSAGMGAAFGGALHGIIGSVTKAGQPMKMSLENIDKTIADMTQVVADTSNDATTRIMAKNEISRLNKTRKQAQAISDIADEKVRARKEKVLVDKFLKETERIARKPESHKNVAKWYGIEVFNDMEKEAIAKKYEKKKETVTDKTVEVKGNVDKVKSKDKEGNLVEQTDKDIVHQHNEENMREYEISEAAETRLKEQEELDKKNTYTEDEADVKEQDRMYSMEDDGYSVHNLPTRDEHKSWSRRFEARGRKNLIDDYLQSMQSTKDKGAQVKNVTPEQKLNTKEELQAELERRMKIYDKKTENMLTYGKEEARDDKNFKYKEPDKHQLEADRRAFMAYQLYHIGKTNKGNKKINGMVQNVLKDLKENKVTRPEYKEADTVRAKEKLDKANPRLGTPLAENRRYRERKREFQKRKTERDKNGRYEKVDKEGTEQDSQKLVNSVRNKNKESKEAVFDAIDKIDRGTKIVDWNGDITDKVRQAYPREAKIIENYRDRQMEVDAYNSGKITPEELRYYEKKRIDEKVKEVESGKYKSKDELETAVNEVSKEYENIGLKRQKQILEPKSEEKSGGIPKPEDPKKKAEREKSEREQNQLKYDEIVKKTKTHIKNWKQEGYEPAVAKSGPKLGERLITNEQKKAAERGYLTSEEIAELSYPKDENGQMHIDENLELARKERRAELFAKEAEMMQKEMGIPKDKTINGKPSKIVFKENIFDVSNSAGQVVAAIWGNKDIAKMVKLGEGSVDGRSLIGKAMEDAGMPKPKPVWVGTSERKTWKDFVKPPFMTQTYGQMRKSAIETMMTENGWSRAYTEKFYDAYLKAVDKVYPGLAEFRESIYSMMKDPDFDGKISYELPDNFKVEFEMKANDMLYFKIGDQSGSVKIKSENLEEMSRALMPNIIHSIDGYIAREMRKEGWDSNHDAFRFNPQTESKELVNKYLEILADLNEKNILQDIGNQIGADFTPPRVDEANRLTREDILNSSEAITSEHTAGKPEDIRARTTTYNYFPSKEDVMRNYMASSSHQQIPTKALQDKLTNDAAYFDMREAKKSDDVFERQTVMAQHSEKYNEKMAIEAPEGVDKKMWDETQRNIFDENRAKLEKNPLFRGEKEGKAKLGGKRIYFDENGNPIGKKNVTMSKLIAEERIRGRNIRQKLLQRYTKQEAKELSKIGNNYEAIAEKVRSWSEDKPLSPMEREAMQIVHEAEMQRTSVEAYHSMQNNETDVKVEDVRKAERQYNLDGEYKAYIKRQISKDEFYNSFNELHATKTSGERVDAKLKEQLRNYWDKKIPKDEETRKGILNHMLLTDVKAIDHLSKKQADEFKAKYKEIYDTNRVYISAMAKAIGRPENQTGFYHNSAEALVGARNLPVEQVRIIDQLISIEAMTDDSWKFAEKYKDTDWYKSIISARKTDEARSRTLFTTNPKKVVKGWIHEEYDKNLMLNEEGKVVYNDTPGTEHGLLGADLESNKVGKTLEQATWKDIDYSKYDTKTYVNPKTMEKVEYIVATERSMAQAKKDRLKITGKEPMAIGGKEVREELGRNNDPIDILTNTTSSINEKETRRSIVKHTIDGDYGLLFAKEEKPGMVKLSDAEVKSLPYGLREHVKYVHKGFKRQLMGATKTQLGNSHIAKLIDKMWKESVTRRKRNIVLNNPASHKTAALYNLSIAGTLGATPKEVTRWHAQVAKESKSNEKLMKIYSAAKAQGKDTLAKKTMERLKKSELFQFELAGLATNVLDGLKDSGDLTSAMLSNLVGNKELLDKAVNELLINQNSTLGKIATSSFSYIDTVGRFMAAKKIQQKNPKLTTVQVAQKANSLFGDMEQIAPVAIQAMDDYGVGMFAKWFSQTLPGTLQVVGENPTKAFLVTLGMFMLSQQLEQKDTTKNKMLSHNLSGANPVEANVDFAEMVSWGSWEDMYYSYKDNDLMSAMVRSFGPNALPAIYTKPLNKYLIEKKREAEGKTSFNNFEWKVFQSLLVPKRSQDYSEGRTKAMPDTEGAVQAMVNSIFPSLDNKKKY